MRFSQVDGVSLVEFRPEPHGGIGSIKNLEIISISFSACDMIIAECRGYMITEWLNDRKDLPGEVLQRHVILLQSLRIHLEM